MSKLENGLENTLEARLEVWLQRIMSGLMIPLIILICFLLAKIFWLFFAPESAAPIIKQSMNQVTGTVSSESSQFAFNATSVAGWNLFGKESIGRPVEKKTERLAEVKAPKTSLNLELSGVFVAKDESDSTAIIIQKGKSGELYHIGDKLPGNATLEHVYADRVLLNRNGRLETLPFPKQSKGPNRVAFSGAADSRGSAGRFNRGFSNAEKKPSRPKPTLTKNGNRSQTPQTLLSTLETNLANNYGQTLSQLGVETLSSQEGGGLRFGDKAPRQLLNMLGMKKGDVIKSINGQTLGDPLQDQALLQQLSQKMRKPGSGESVSAVIESGGRRFTVNLDLP